MIAIGDHHGDLFYSLATLHSAGVIDQNGQWSLGDAIVVQVGDILDRGDDCRYILDFYHKLGQEAEAAGGQVIQLLGNHEIMNLGNQLRYVTKGDFSLFGGRTNRAKAFRPSSEYGRRVRQFPLVATVNDTVFVHGGIMPVWAEKGVAELNRLAAKALAEENYWRAPIWGSDGPIWARDLIYNAQQGDCGLLQDTLSHLSRTEGRPMRRMVVGHTPMSDGKVNSFCDGALVDVDIAMSRGMRGGRVGALGLAGTAKGAVVATALPLSTPTFDAQVAQTLERTVIKDFHAKYMNSPYPPMHSLNDAEEL